MKIIDLLNKIANNEELPKKIKYKNNIYEYDGETQNYCSPINMIWDFLIGKDIVALLNDEVEIIKEDKKIKKLPYYSLEKIQKSKNKDEWYENRLKLLEKRINDYHNKINELIDEINNLKESD